MPERVESESAGVVMDPAARLAELAATITRQHEAAVAAGRAMVEHAIACGEALLEAKTLIPPGEWSAWLETSLPQGVRRAMSQNYMRLATLKEHVDPTLSITSNLQLLRGMEKRSTATPRVPQEVKREALRLHATGAYTRAEIARLVGTTSESVRCWVDPEYAAHRSAQMGEARRRLVAKRAPKPLVDPGDRAYTYGEPGRAAIGQAVRRLAQVQGAQQTHDALGVLAAICEAWADRLVAGPLAVDPRFAEESAA